MGAAVHPGVWQASPARARIQRRDAVSFGSRGRLQGQRRIEGNVWRAGADSDAVLFGISFVARGWVLLNTIHIAALDTSTAFPLAAGFRSVTLPNKRLKLAARVH